MAIQGMILTRGSLCTVKRATRGTPADPAMRDGSSQQAWATVETRRRILLEPITSATAERIWGQESEATVRGIAALEADIRVGDGIIVDAGAYAADHYRVTAPPMRHVLGSKHLELALALTPEAFA